MTSFYRKRQSDIAIYSLMNGDLVYWKSIQELMEELQLEHTSGQWRLFIDSSEVSLKALLLHNGNKVPFYPTDPCNSHVRNVQEPSGFAAKNTLWRTPVECMCWPKSYSSADWAARRMH
jgi:hypothetical protein